MIHLGSSSMDNVWNILKETKLNVYDKCVNGLYSENILMSQLETVHKKLNMNATEDIFDNITDTTLKSAAEMFLFLNSCPDDFRYWFLLYSDLFENKSPEVIVLTLNRILKGERNTENRRLKDIAKHLLTRVTTLLSLKFETIQGVTKAAGNSSWNGGDGQLNIQQLILQHFVNADLSAVNHPVHIITKDKQMSPSALIPFCEFGGEMSKVGVMIDHFEIPVCNSFESKIINDQLCYEIDLNKFSNKNDIDKELKTGLAFIMDYNEDRQVTFNQDSEKVIDKGLVSRIDKSDDSEHAFVFLNTIGKYPYPK